jgi:hypothetical protein
VRKYTLTPLIQVREAVADQAKRDLGEQIAARTEAERTLAERIRDEHAHRSHTEAIRHAEQMRLQTGALRAADMLHMQAYVDRAALEQRTLEEVRQTAEQALVAQRATEDAARVSLAQRQADLDLVRRHRERWDAEQKAAILAADDENAAEAFQGRRPRP